MLNEAQGTTHIGRHIEAFKKGRITADQVKEACPFALPPDDQTNVAAIIHRTVADEGHVANLPRGAVEVKMTAEMYRILAVLELGDNVPASSIATHIKSTPEAIKGALDRMLNASMITRQKLKSRGTRPVWGYSLAQTPEISPPEGQVVFSSVMGRKSGVGPLTGKNEGAAQ
ncbi:MAG: hypothetical protein U5N55_10800 [Cypionkella sp.]|nr:hypothetical protein [Cypionkella sp.]